MTSETRIKAGIYLIAAIVAPFLACNMARCFRLSRLLWDRGHSHASGAARFYFVVIMGLVVIITQNVFIRRALSQKESCDQEREGR